MIRTINAMAATARSAEPDPPPSFFIVVVLLLAWTICTFWKAQPPPRQSAPVSSAPNDSYRHALK
eukprot:CAMPEP_0201633420 /NCGR_PEP_ID=MMETSP0493-20130528/6733_1 /ASSEMBLY_ACC=CAM_ASM_000838 /TAXON_ID=420259 /ORGANISM="Thalassiosira gravida, Strain GMp14c1" /LENGTH=64 /DNA_ID=CAMNT_0048105127 /DNA_START=398 /DNA_END=592 /DNA_ORIENTATION=+